MCLPAGQSLANLGSPTSTEEGGETAYIDRAIVLIREGLDLCPPNRPGRFTASTLLVSCLECRYKQFGRIKDLNEVIALAQDELCLPGNPFRSTCLNNLAGHLSTRYRRLKKIDDLHEAITLIRNVLVLSPLGQPNRPRFLNNLVSHLSERYNRLGGIDDLNEAVSLAQDALALCPPEYSDRSICLTNLADLLCTRYQKLGVLEELHEAIALTRDVLVLHPLGHANRPRSLNNLGSYLAERYGQLGGIDDLDEAISLAQEVLTLQPPGQPNRSTSLDNLASRLFARYEQLRKIDDINEAISLARDALSLRPLGHPDRSISLNNLASHLSNRYNHLGAIDDLNEAVSLARDVLPLFPLGHPGRSTCLNNFAHHLSTRYRQFGGIDDLNEAIASARDALSLCPPGHPDRSTSLNNLASHLSDLYDQLGAIENLNEAVALGRVALSVVPPGHPNRSRLLNNLASQLSTRYKQLKATEDLNEAVALSRDALALFSPGHPARLTSLRNLALHLNIRFKQLGRTEDQEELFGLYAELEHVPHMVSSSDLSAAKEWVSAAEEVHHPSTLLAYRTALRFLLQYSTALPSLPQHLTVLKTLSSSLAADAFSACLRNSSSTIAIELLEQGRGIFWSQLTRLRSPLDDVIASGRAGKMLADEFKRLTSLIRAVLDSPSPDQHDRVCRLNSELEKVASDIRRLPGLSRFLHPPLFTDLQSAASAGPVIVVNASKYSCDAVVIFDDRDPVHIPLSVTKQGVRELSSRLFTLTVHAKKMDMTREIGVFLRDLWRDVVSCVVDFLLTACPRGSRIWWCPTAEFSLLPLHAAGPYRNSEKNLSDHYISSYTPTLSALIRARQSTSPDSATERKHFAAIGQAKAAGTSELHSVSTELANIGRLVNGPAMFTCIEGQDCCITRVAEELGKNEWVHLACHGVPDRKQPFESAFALHDGRFTIQRIIQCDLKNSEFAYLSACHTTVGSEESPDEMIHLASAMQFAGFRSVIGTMWAVDDAHTNKVTSAFYKHMVDESGRLDHTRAAIALRKAQRTVDIPLDQRILYIHLGA